ncbi:putative ribosome biogenesis GTPase RsgA [Luteitalea sp. TBR-22]|uniref:ribosome small subunit-dependent GTPase A n=1 Tax=Luteitalea sp. TBR-22 TaxID=2802971 RepID=UPI001EF5E2F9|nr:ribosome small subunit-dependent GTPase A [Luteitalea sp. TBR-22]BCS34316.2 putative ribosome biogenesis GTPase RsgA [Luteitalea sp. TBR-22]
MDAEVTLEVLGWDARWAEAWAAHHHDGDGRVPARVVVESQHIYRVHTGREDLLARITGRIRHKFASREAFPAVGDWVALKPAGAAEEMARIVDVLPRRGRFVRKAAGTAAEAQVVAANVDVVFLVSGLDHDFSVRRIERYLLAAMEGGASPVIVLNKADLPRDQDEVRHALGPVAGHVPVVMMSARSGVGVDELRAHIGPGRTAAFLGSSGVGKSTLINRLIGRDVQRTAEVRESDSKGRHTTTHRELVVLPGGGLLIDTPGMRELQLWDVSTGLDDAFEDIATLGVGCRFRDCTHDTEPDCTVKVAVAEGRLAAERLANYQRLRKEVLAKPVEEADIKAAAERRRDERVASKALKKLYSNRLKTQDSGR